jgi:hypothetical protein
MTGSLAYGKAGLIVLTMPLKIMEIKNSNQIAILILTV